MANVAKNIVTEGLRGTLEGTVFRAYRDRNGRTRTVVGRSPTFSGEWSEGQKLHRQRFRAASRYADSIKDNPVKRQEYERIAKRKCKTWRTIAIQDWFRHQNEAAEALLLRKATGIL